MGGAYLSRPVKEKISDDESNGRLSYGVSSMQGWRVKQEDAHNCIIDFDENTSIFGVYDGHGGFEVAKYTSEKLPDFIRNTKKYQDSNYKEALIEAFLGFDDTIPTPDVMAVLKKMVDADRDKSAADADNSEEDSDDQEDASKLIYIRRGIRAGCSSVDVEDDDDLETPESLRLDASKPIEEVMASYRVPSINKLMNSEIGAKPASPYLRSRREPAVGRSSEGCSSRSVGECSSSSIGSSESGASSSSGASGDTESKVDGGSEDKPKLALNGEAKQMANKCKKSSCAIPEKSVEENSTPKCSKSGSLSNGPSGDGLVNGTASPLNGDITEDAVPEKRSKSVPCESSSLTEIPSTSPKKKKLALDDLDDSTVVKNFITNDEIAECDEDDSEDETFHLSEEHLHSDDDDDDDDDDTSFRLDKNSIAQQFLKRLNQCANLDDDYDDDDDDDEDEDVDEEDEADSNESNEEPAEEEEEGDEGDKGEAEDEDEESDEESDCDEDGTCNLFPDSDEQPGIDSGCTAVVALLRGNQLYVANAGDSRCVICKAGKAIDMSEDHKPEDDAERARIIKAGGVVSSDGRVNGGLNLSRAIGDHCYKKNKELPNTEQMITALPDVRVMEMEPDVEFIVLACDGIWNSMTSQDVVDFIRPRIETNQKLSSICEELFDKCLASNTCGDGTGCDNMTCVIVKPLRDDGVERKGDAAVNIPVGSDTSNGKQDADDESVAPSAESVTPASEPSEKSENATADAVASTPAAKAQKRNAEESAADAEDSCKRLKTDDTSMENSSSSRANETV